MHKNKLGQKTPKKLVLRNFQIFCKAIPTWNDTLLNNESDRIKKACPFLMDLLTAVFVSNVKILAAIKLKGNSKNIKIKIPTTNIFIHKIYLRHVPNSFTMSLNIITFIDHFIKMKTTEKIDWLR